MGSALSFSFSGTAGALREAIRLEPDFAGAHTTLAGVLRALGDVDGAAVEAGAGATIAKQTTDMQAAVFATNSGKRLLNAGDVDGAISQFRVAVAARPNYAPGHFQLGQALKRKGAAFAEEAERELKRAGELDARLGMATK